MAKQQENKSVNNLDLLKNLVLYSNNANITKRAQIYAGKGYSPEDSRLGAVLDLLTETNQDAPVSFSPNDLSDFRKEAGIELPSVKGNLEYNYDSNLNSELRYKPNNSNLPWYQKIWEGFFSNNEDKLESRAITRLGSKVTQKEPLFKMGSFEVTLPDNPFLDPIEQKRFTEKDKSLIQAEMAKEYTQKFESLYKTEENVVTRTIKDGLKDAVDYFLPIPSDIVVDALLESKPELSPAGNNYDVAYNPTKEEIHPADVALLRNTKYKDDKEMQKRIADEYDLQDNLLYRGVRGAIGQIGILANLYSGMGAMKMMGGKFGKIAQIMEEETAPIAKRLGANFLFGVATQSPKQLMNFLDTDKNLGEEKTATSALYDIVLSPGIEQFTEGLFADKLLNVSGNKIINSTANWAKMMLSEQVEEEVGRIAGDVLKPQYNDADKTDRVFKSLVLSLGGAEAAKEAIVVGISTALWGGVASGAGKLNRMRFEKLYGKEASEILLSKIAESRQKVFTNTMDNLTNVIERELPQFRSVISQISNSKEKTKDFFSALNFNTDDVVIDPQKPLLPQMMEATYDNLKANSKVSDLALQDYDFLNSDEILKNIDLVNEVSDDDKLNIASFLTENKISADKKELLSNDLEHLITLNKFVTPQSNYILKLIDKHSDILDGQTLEKKIYELIPSIDEKQRAVNLYNNMVKVHLNNVDINGYKNHTVTENDIKTLQKLLAVPDKDMNENRKKITDVLLSKIADQYNPNASEEENKLSIEAMRILSSNFEDDSHRKKYEGIMKKISTSVETKEKDRIKNLYGSKENFRTDIINGYISKMIDAGVQKTDAEIMGQIFDEYFQGKITKDKIFSKYKTQVKETVSTWKSKFTIPDLNSILKDIDNMRKFSEKVFVSVNNPIINNNNVNKPKSDEILPEPELKDIKYEAIEGMLSSNYLINELYRTKGFVDSVILNDSDFKDALNKITSNEYTFVKLEEYKKFQNEIGSKVEALKNEFTSAKNEAEVYAIAQKLEPYLKLLTYISENKIPSVSGQSNLSLEQIELAGETYGEMRNIISNMINGNDFFIISSYKPFLIRFTNDKAEGAESFKKWIPNSLDSNDFADTEEYKKQKTRLINWGWQNVRMNDKETKYTHSVNNFENRFDFEFEAILTPQGLKVYVTKGHSTLQLGKNTYKIASVNNAVTPYVVYEDNGQYKEVSADELYQTNGAGFFEPTVKGGYSGTKREEVFQKLENCSIFNKMPDNAKMILVGILDYLDVNELSVDDSVKFKSYLNEVENELTFDSAVSLMYVNRLVAQLKKNKVIVAPEISANLQAMAYKYFWNNKNWNNRASVYIGDATLPVIGTYSDNVKSVFEQINNSNIIADYQKETDSAGRERFIRGYNENLTDDEVRTIKDTLHILSNKRKGVNYIPEHVVKYSFGDADMKSVDSKIKVALLNYISSSYGLTSLYFPKTKDEDLKVLNKLKEAEPELFSRIVTEFKTTGILEQDEFNNSKTEIKRKFIDNLPFKVNSQQIKFDENVEYGQINITQNTYTFNPKFNDVFRFDENGDLIGYNESSPNYETGIDVIEHELTHAFLEPLIQNDVFTSEIYDIFNEYSLQYKELAELITNDSLKFIKDADINDRRKFVSELLTWTFGSPHAGVISVLRNIEIRPQDKIENVKNLFDWFFAKVKDFIAKYFEQKDLTTLFDYLEYKTAVELEKYPEYVNNISVDDINRVQEYNLDFTSYMKDLVTGVKEVANSNTEIMSDEDFEYIKGLTSELYTSDSYRSDIYLTTTRFNQFIDDMASLLGMDMNGKSYYDVLKSISLEEFRNLFIIKESDSLLVQNRKKIYIKMLLSSVDEEHYVPTSNISFDDKFAILFNQKVTDFYTKIQAIESKLFFDIESLKLNPNKEEHAEFIATGAKSITVVKKLGERFKVQTPSGVIHRSSFRHSVPIEYYMNDICDLIGISPNTLKIAFINSYWGNDFANGKPTRNFNEWGGVTGSKTEYITNLLQRNGLIGLLNFADKDTAPVVYINSENKEEIYNKVYDSILPYFKMYQQFAIKNGIDISELYNPENPAERNLIVSTTLRLLLEERKYGNSIANIQKGFSAVANRDMIEVMKRTKLVGELKEIVYDNKIMNSLIKTGLVSTEEGSPFYWDGKELYIKTIAIHGEQDSESRFLNENGIFIFDGCNFYLKGQYDEISNSIIGSVNEGIRKDWLFYQNMLGKQSTQGIGRNNIFGQIMAKGKYGIIIFDSNEKNGIKRNGTKGIFAQNLEGEEIDLSPFQYATFDEVIGANFNNQEELDLFYSYALSERKTNEPVDKSFYYPFRDIHNIMQYHSNKTKSKGNQQIINSSGGTINNPCINDGFIEYMKTMVERSVRKLNEIVTSPVKMNELVGNRILGMMKNPTNYYEMQMSLMFNKYRKLSPTALVEQLEKYRNLDILQKTLHDFMNKSIESCVKLESDGCGLGLGADGGEFLADRYDYANESLDDYILINYFKEQSGMKNKIISSNLEMIEDYKSEVRKMKYYNGLGQRYTIKTNYDKLISDIKLNMMFGFSQEEKASINVPEDFIKVAKNSISEEDKTNYQNYVELKKKEVFTDRKFLKEGWSYIDKATADRMGIRTGQDIIVTITPSDSAMGIMTAKAIVIPTNVVDPSTIVMNSQRIQGVGKDFDGDKLSVFIRPSDISLNKWTEYCNSIQEMNDKYLEESYKLICDTLRLEAKKNPTKTEMYNVAFGKNQTEFMKSVLGTKKNVKKRYSPIEKAVSTLNDNYHKNVGYVVKLRQMHQYLSDIGLSFSVPINGKMHKVDFTDSKQWFKAHYAMLILTNHQVDYPKTIDKDYYNHDDVDIFALMCGLNFQELDNTDKKTIANIYQRIDSATSTLFNIPRLSKNKYFDIKGRERKKSTAVSVVENITSESMNNIPKRIEEIVKKNNGTEISVKDDMSYPIKKLIADLNVTKLIEAVDRYLPAHDYKIFKFNQGVETTIMLNMLKKYFGLSDKALNHAQTMIDMGVVQFLKGSYKGGSFSKTGIEIHNAFENLRNFDSQFLNAMFSFKEGKASVDITNPLQNFEYTKNYGVWGIKFMEIRKKLLGNVKIKKGEGKNISEDLEVLNKIFNGKATDKEIEDMVSFSEIKNDSYKQNLINKLKELNSKPTPESKWAFINSRISMGDLLPGTISNILEDTWANSKGEAKRLWDLREYIRFIFTGISEGKKKANETFYEKADVKGKDIKSASTDGNVRKHSIGKMALQVLSKQNNLATNFDLSTDKYTFEFRQDEADKFRLFDKEGTLLEKSSTIRNGSAIKKFFYDSDTWESVDNRLVIDNALTLSNPANLEESERFTIARAHLVDYMRKHDIKLEELEIVLVSLMGMTNDNSIKNLFVTGYQNSNNTLYTLMSQFTPELWNDYLEQYEALTAGQKIGETFNVDRALEQKGTEDITYHMAGILANSFGNQNQIISYIHSVSEDVVSDIGEFKKLELSDKIKEIQKKATLEAVRMGAQAEGEALGDFIDKLSRINTPEEMNKYINFEFIQSFENKIAEVKSITQYKDGVLNSLFATLQRIEKDNNKGDSSFWKMRLNFGNLWAVAQITGRKIYNSYTNTLENKAFKEINYNSWQSREEQKDFELLKEHYNIDPHIVWIREFPVYWHKMSEYGIGEFNSVNLVDYKIKNLNNTMSGLLDKSTNLFTKRNQIMVDQAELHTPVDILQFQADSAKYARLLSKDANFEIRYSKGKSVKYIYMGEVKEDPVAFAKVYARHNNINSNNNKQIYAIASAVLTREAITSDISFMCYKTLNFFKYMQNEFSGTGFEAEINTLVNKYSGYYKILIDDQSFLRNTGSSKKFNIRGYEREVYIENYVSQMMRQAVEKYRMEEQRNGRTVINISPEKIEELRENLRQEAVAKVGFEDIYFPFFSMDKQMEINGHVDSFDMDIKFVEKLVETIRRDILNVYQIQFMSDAIENNLSPKIIARVNAEFAKESHAIRFHSTVTNLEELNKGDEIAFYIHDSKHKEFKFKKGSLNRIDQTNIYIEKNGKITSYPISSLFINQDNEKITGQKVYKMNKKKGSDENILADEHDTIAKIVSGYTSALMHLTMGTLFGTASAIRNHVGGRFSLLSHYPSLLFKISYLKESDYAKKGKDFLNPEKARTYTELGQMELYKALNSANRMGNQLLDILGLPNRVETTKNQAFGLGDQKKTKKFLSNRKKREAITNEINAYIEKLREEARQLEPRLTDPNAREMHLQIMKRIGNILHRTALNPEELGALSEFGSSEEQKYLDILYKAINNGYVPLTDKMITKMNVELMKQSLSDFSFKKMQAVEPELRLTTMGIAKERIQSLVNSKEITPELAAYMLNLNEATQGLYDKIARRGYDNGTIGKLFFALHQYTQQMCQSLRKTLGEIRYNQMVYGIINTYFNFKGAIELEKETQEIMINPFSNMQPFSFKYNNKNGEREAIADNATRRIVNLFYVSSIISSLGGIIPGLGSLVHPVFQSFNLLVEAVMEALGDDEEAKKRRNYYKLSSQLLQMVAGMGFTQTWELLTYFVDEKRKFQDSHRIFSTTQKAYEIVADFAKYNNATKSALDAGNFIAKTVTGFGFPMYENPLNSYKALVPYYSTYDKNFNHLEKERDKKKDNKLYLKKKRYEYIKKQREILLENR